MEPLKIGIIGCGGIANGKHMPSIQQLDGVEMVAFCDIIPERAQAAAEKYGAPGAKVYTDYRELLRVPEINNVRILTPNYLHAQMSIDAMRAGKHVMCEKPMAMNYAQAQEMLGDSIADLARSGLISNDLGEVLAAIVAARKTIVH